jgi:hypothetical protein
VLPPKKKLKKREKKRKKEKEKEKNVLKIKATKKIGHHKYSYILGDSPKMGG